MASETSPAVENYRTTVRTVGGHIVIEHVVAPECLTQTVRIRARKMLLPVKPPEIHAFTFMLADNCAEERISKISIIKIPGNCLARRCIHIILASEILIHGGKEFRRLHTVHAVGRVQVKRYLEITVMHLLQEPHGVRYKVGIP